MHVSSTRTALAAAVSSRHVAEAATWRLTAAPAPDALLWPQLGLRSWQAALRRALVTAGARAAARVWPVRGCVGTSAVHHAMIMMAWSCVRCVVLPPVTMPRTATE
jgi:hypothetical protein